MDPTRADIIANTAIGASVFRPSSMSSSENDEEGEDGGGGGERLVGRNCEKCLNSKAGPTVLILNVSSASS